MLGLTEVEIVATKSRCWLHAKQVDIIVVVSVDGGQHEGTHKFLEFQDIDAQRRSCKKNHDNLRIATCVVSSQHKAVIPDGHREVTRYLSH